MTMASKTDSTRDESEDAAVESSEAESALETARRQLYHAANYLDIDPNIVERLKHPKKVHEVTIPIERDNGTVETCSPTK